MIEITPTLESSICAPQHGPLNKIVDDRIRKVLHSTLPIETCWMEVAERTYQEIENYCVRIYYETHKTPPELLSQLPIPIGRNVDADLDSLMEHNFIMQEMLKCLWDFKIFRDLFPKKTTFTFIKTAVLLHDFPRFIFNGPLRYTDTIGENLIHLVFPNFPSSRYLHTIKWLTGESEPPSIPDNSIIPAAVPLVFKAIDTLSKANRNPETFFQDPSGYQGWLKFQEQNNRFPLIIPATGRTISAEEYAKRDERLTLQGVEIIEKMTGNKFTQLRNTAIGNLSVLPSEEHYL